MNRKSNKNKQRQRERNKISNILARRIGNGFVMQLFNVRDRPCKRKRSERCPNIAVRWKRAVEVGGGEEKRLGGSCGESFLNEGSEQYRPTRGSCSFAQITKKQSQGAIPLPQRKRHVC